MRVSENGYISVSNMLKGYFQNSPFPKGLQDIPVVGGILFGNSFFFYLAVACAVALYWYLNKTRSGLYLRSVGESPRPRTPPASTSRAISTSPPSSAAV